MRGSRFGAERGRLLGGRGVRATYFNLIHTLKMLSEERPRNTSLAVGQKIGERLRDHLAFLSLKRQMARWQLCSAPLAPLGSTRSARLRSAPSAPLGSARLHSAPLGPTTLSPPLVPLSSAPRGCVHDLAEATSPARQTWRLRLRNAKRSHSTAFVSSRGSFLLQGSVR